MKLGETVWYFNGRTVAKVVIDKPVEGQKNVYLCWFEGCGTRIACIGERLFDTKESLIKAMDDAILKLTQLRGEI